jgi:6-phosphogluconolactonase/glucosamine-6-phosphate isomerase/deaminase
MGEDGTRLLIPWGPDIERRRRFVSSPPTQTGQKRVSITSVIDKLTGPRSGAGSEKAPVLKEILNKGSEPLSYPASMVHPADGVLEWYVDKAAAPWL